MKKKTINRSKVAPVEHHRNYKWLAEKLKKNTATVSRWCTNDVQPPLETLVEIAELLGINYKDLLNDEIKDIKR